MADLLLDREVILLGGNQSSGKSYSVVKLIEQGMEEDFKVMVIDRDRGIAKAIKEVFGKKIKLSALHNLDYRLITSWEDILEAVEDVFANLGAGDWLVFEHVGKIWDFAQEEFSRAVYGEDVGNHLLALRADVQAELKAKGIDLRMSEGEDKKTANAAVAKQMQYSGMEGRTDWTVIKRQHNGSVFDKVIVEGEFNILSTTAMTPLQDSDLKNNRWTDFHKYGMRPEGEKHQVYRHDTVAIVYKKDGTFCWRTDLGGEMGKDRGRELVRDISFSDIGFIQSYLKEVEA